MWLRTRGLRPAASADLARRVHLPGDTLKDLAQIHGIPLIVTKDHNDAVSQTILKKGGIDIIAFTGGGLIRKSVLDIPRLGVLNCHMGLLPPYRGMDVVEWPFLDPAEGEPQVGLTLHFMDKGVDTGPILIRQALALRQGDTFASIRSRMEPLMVQLVLEGLRGLRDGCLVPQPQIKDAGRQYFLMHPRILEHAERKLQRKVLFTT